MIVKVERNNETEVRELNWAFQKRQEKSLSLFNGKRVIRRKNYFEVYGSQLDPYIIKNGTCTCPDFIYSELGFCCHTMAVEKYIANERVNRLRTQP